MPVVCNQCQNPYCMNVCPAKAYEKTESGTVVIHSDRCVGCGICISYCPEELVHINPETKKAVKCDMCHGAPECVAACPTGALELAFRADGVTAWQPADNAAQESAMTKLATEKKAEEEATDE